MKVAILYICTGKYSIFWAQFYKSCEQYFLSSHRKTYFVFSDTKNNHTPQNVKIIHQRKMGWPNDTLMRFHLFDSIRSNLKDFDYVFFCNANLIFKKPVNDEIFFNENKHAELIVVKHPFFYWVKDPINFPYERRKRSMARMKKKEGQMYVFGAFNGGSSNAYLKLIKELKNRIDIDLKKNIVALWHDESHLNKYIFETQENIKILDCNYAFPEDHDLPQKDDVYIEVLDKAKLGGHDFLREKENSIPVPKKKKSLFSILKTIRRFAKKANSN